MEVVSDLPTGRVQGRYIFVSQDAADEGTSPDAVLVTGSVRFTCSASPPLLYRELGISVVPLVHEASFDNLGHVVPLGQTERFIELLAADSPLVNPQGFTWQVSFNLTEVATGRTVNLPSFPIYVAEGETVDLTDHTPVGVSGGVPIVRGEQGDPGEKGDPGAGTKGDPGPSNVLAIGTVTSGATASATITGTSPKQTLNLQLPKGEPGASVKGDPGPAGSLSIGTVTQGTTPSATITGTAPSQTLNLVLVKGDSVKGDPGTTPPVKNIPFIVRYVGSAWEYASLAAAKTAGLVETQVIWFVGGTAAPTWARPGDIFTQP